MSELKLRKKIKKRWVAALLSGDYPQGRGRLKRQFNGVDSYCCLGVLCDLAAQDGVVEWRAYEAVNPATGEGSAWILPNVVVDWAFKGGRGTRNLGDPTVMREDGRIGSLAELNDGIGPRFPARSFPYIAKVIKEQL